MSLTSVESSMVIESQAVSLSSPGKPKASSQHAGVYLEMNVMSDSSRVPSFANETPTLEPRPPSSLERTNSLPPGRGVDQMETIWKPYKNRYRILAACFTALGNGMNDAANGALIESLEKYRDQSLCFLANFTDGP